MKKWEERSIEIATLLNPAFCGYLLSLGIKGYTEQAQENAPYVFPFIMLPLVLHKPTREKLPKKVGRKTFLTWIDEQEIIDIVKIDFAERAKNLVPYVKEALLFAIKHNIIELTNAGMLISKNENINTRRYINKTEEIEECIEISEKCGKLIAKAGNFNMVMISLGVTV